MLSAGKHLVVRGGMRRWPRWLDSLNRTRGDCRGTEPGKYLGAPHPSHIMAEMLRALA